MKIIYNRHLPPRNFTAINLFGIIFARKEYRYLSRQEINHEKIHTRQIIEMFGPVYYVIYFVEWLFRLWQYRNPLIAYRNISFEREAYENDRNYNYLKERKLFSFINYYKNNKR